ncbi:Helix-turn-helix domain-containing protein [Rhodovastum atsumiense]|uniref:helix-turn-helix domain-containing protein n=1 Tax=Rhodovastum atsumiense TaxID=504468 RepID=UPI00139F2D10|nr:helix-turn-helix domain-containing protein [Rhodovastum atsumiense]CAH2603648.1 Helix-turn-helix domain-containing protein [Rhodovastum atsumiense]
MLQVRRSAAAPRGTAVSPLEDPGGPGHVLRVGADLQAARERLGWDLEAIGGYLRIRPAVLRAIEEGRPADLPALAYVIGHVRSYAQLLGLDPDEVARRFRAEAAGLARQPELSFPTPVPDRGVPAGAVVLLGVTLAIGAYVGWYRVSGSQPGEPPVRQVPERLATLVQPPPAPVPLAAAVPAAPVTAAGPATDQPMVLPFPTAAGPGQMASVTPPPALTPLPPSSAAAAIPATGVFGPPLAAGTTTAAALPPLPEGTRIVLRAKADAWLQVRDRQQGQVLLNRVLRAGETWPVPPRERLVLTTGNAGGTEVLVDGQLTAALGIDGAVRRDLPLDPEAIREGRLAPSVTAARAAPKPPAQ